MLAALKSLGPRFGKARKPEPSPLPRAAFDDGKALSTAIASAWIVPREADDDGPRVMVHSNALGAPFIYDREVATKRISSRFPTLTDAELKAALLHLEGRIRLALAPHIEERRRNNWVHGWMQER